jgi:arylsulfatase A-like enzyme
VICLVVAGWNAPATSAMPGAQAVAASQQRQARPNVVLLVTDDQTLTDLGVMTRTRSFFRSRGVRFTRAFSQFPLCCPARASLLTGQLAHNHHVQSNDPPRGGVTAFDARETLAVWLRRAGYRTAMVGKYLNGYPLPGGKRHVPRGWADWQAPIQNVYDYVIFRVNENGRLRHHRGYQAGWVQDRVSGLVRRYARTSRPFFIWANFLAPHIGRPIEPDDPIRRVGARGVGTPAVEARFRNSLRSRPLPRKPSINERDVSDKGRVVRVGPKPRWQLHELYTQRLESLRSVDRAVAGIIATLRRTHRLDNTLLLFTSDNGYLVGEHRLLGKSMPYEESVRVPLLMAGPGVPAGVARSQLVGLVDIPRTIVQVARARPRRVQDGRSLLPLAVNPAAGRERALLLEGEARLRGQPRLFTAVRTGDDKVLIRWRSGIQEVYDLARDPYQLNGRVSTAEAAEVPRLRRLLRRMQACRGYRACAGLPG